jgi:hypothetical protein
VGIVAVAVRGGIRSLVRHFRGNSRVSRAVSRLVVAVKGGIRIFSRHSGEAAQ